VNGVAPGPVRNAEFTRVLAAVLERPAPLLVPASALRLLLGEMAQELLLSSTRVRPERLTRAGFGFRFGDLESALRFELGRENVAG
jgi:NAD dependent epimerase/dehydratase family enzyme